MKNLKRIDEAVGSIVERRAAADRLLKDVVKGSTSSVEGIKLSKEMAQAFLDWQRMSTYGKKFGKLPFYMLFTAAFNWGLDRYIGKDKKIKDEYKELKAKAKEMSKQQKMKAESLNESTAKNVLKDAINALTKTFAGKKLDKAYVKDYIASMERIARKSPREFVKDYMNFSNDDWIEDVEYNMANESKDFKPHMMYDPETGEEYKAEKPEDHERMSKLGYVHEKPEKVDEGLLGQVRKEIGKTQTDLKKKWKKTGGYENFGQDEISKLQDRYGYSSMVYGTPEQRKAAKLIDALDQWAMNYVGESVDEGFRRSREPFTFTAKEVQDAADLIAKAITRLDKVKAEVHDMEYDEGEGAGFEISIDGEKYDGGSYVVRPTGEVVNVAIGNSFPNAIYAKIGDKNINQIIKNIKKFESVEVNEARFVKSYDTKVNDAETEKEVLKIYPKAQFFVGKLTHFFGELEPNLFFKAYYPKYYKQDTGKSVKGDFKITSVYSKKGSNYVELMKESLEVNEAAPRMKTSKETEELERIKKLVVNARKGGMGNRYGKEFDKAKNKAVVALDNMISYSKIGS